MKKVSIYNNYSHNHQNKRNRITQLLREQGLTPMSNGEIVVVIGGDGTFLSAVKERYKDNPVFVGLNSGTLGFFSEYDFSDAKKFVELIARKQYYIANYPIYEVEIIQKNGITSKELFINDVVIERKSPKAIHLESKINDTHSFIYATDALVVSSSIGSGAYNMSAGGAVFLEHNPILQISPIAQLRSKVYQGPLNPIVINDNSTIEVVPNIKKKLPFRIVCDGKEINVRNVQKIKIHNTNKTFRMLRFNQFDYTKQMKDKLF